MSRHRASVDDEPAEQPVAGAEVAPQQSPEPRPRPAPAPAPVRRFRQRGPVLLVAGLVATAVAIAAAVVAIRHEESPTPARATTAGPAAPAADVAGLTSPAAAQAFVVGATTDITAVTAYDYRSLDIALSAGLEVTTGAYRQAYRTAITGDLGTRARSERIVQTFEQTAAGIGTITARGTQAKVLIFGQQSVVRGGGSPVTTPVTLTATVVKQGGRFLISELQSGGNAGLPPGTAQLGDAAETARRHVVASLTLRRSTLAADYVAALADTIDPRRADLAATLAPQRLAVQRGQYDLSGRVTAIAVERVVANAAGLLIVATGLRTAGGRTSVVVDARLRVTTIRTTSGWKVTDVQPVS